MDRRTALAVIAGAAAVRGEIRYQRYSRCLPDYLERLAKQALDKRNATLGSIRTPAQFKARQRWARETFWQLVGGEPERTALNTKVTGGFDRAAWRVEKLLYESQPGLQVPALLYIPKLHKPPYPGILFQQGHSQNGKAYDSYQKCCQSLASLGYLVLSFDPAGQGERTYYPKPNGTDTRLRSADAEHDRAGELLLLSGDTCTRLQTWDAVRSLDVLASHPLVDKARLASTGQSGGGTLTMFLSAVDDRLAAVAISSGNTENFACENFHAPGSVDDAEQNFIGSGQVGFDRWDVLYPIAPKPLLLTASARDWFGTYSPDYLENGRAEFARLQSFYKMLGKPDAIEWYESPLPHALAKDMRLQVYKFFGKHLMGGKPVEEEPQVAPEPDSILQVGTTGNVVRDFNSKTPADIARSNRLKVKPTFNADPVPAGSKLKVVASTPAENGSIQGVEVLSAENVWLPGYVFLPSAKPRNVIIVLEPRGRTAHWHEGDLYPQLAAAGNAVAAFDLRGMGDVSAEIGPGNPHYTRSHANEESYAWASLMLGKPLLLQRVTDILAIVQALKNQGPRLILAASGHLTVPAVIAATKTPDIHLLYSHNGRESFRSLLDDPDAMEPIANLLPGVANGEELPEWRSSLGSRYRQGTAWDVETLKAL